MRVLELVSCRELGLLVLYLVVSLDGTLGNDGVVGLIMIPSGGFYMSIASRSTGSQHLELLQIPK